MKCFYHPDRDAAGTCSHCGKAACHECLEDVGGAMLCRGCKALAVAEIEEQEAAEEAERLREITKAKKRLARSRVLFFASAIFIAVIGWIAGVESLISKGPEAPSALEAIFLPPLMAIGIGYLLWGTYWGVPPAWRLWRRVFESIGCFLVANPATWIVLVAMFFYIPVVMGYFYGALGGGFYEYRKCLQIVQRA